MRRGWSCPRCWFCGRYTFLQLLICIHPRRVCEFSAGSPPHKQPPSTPPTNRVFQMNNARRVTTNSRSGEKLNMWESRSKMGFICWMWRGFWGRSKRGSAIPSPPVVMQWSCSAQNQTRCIKTAALAQTGVQQQEDRERSGCGSSVQTNLHPAQTERCRPRRTGSAGDFFCFPACFWRVVLKTLADRRSSFARPYPKTWTYAQPLCRTACQERTWRPLLCSFGRPFCSRKRRSWTKKRRSENWPQSWLAVRARAAQSPGTRGPEAGGKKLGPKTLWEMYRGAPLTLWRNYHRLYSRWNRDWKI